MPQAAARSHSNPPDEPKQQCLGIPFSSTDARVISIKDRYRGQTVKAVIGLRSSHQGLVSEEDMLDGCCANRAVYQCPRLVPIVESLPKSGAGKVMWRA